MLTLRELIAAGESVPAWTGSSIPSADIGRAKRAIGLRYADKLSLREIEPLLVVLEAIVEQIADEAAAEGLNDSADMLQRAQGHLDEASGLISWAASEWREPELDAYGYPLNNGRLSASLYQEAVK